MIAARMMGITLILLALASIGLCQKRIVVMGSSTAAGNGASTYENSWVGRLQSLYRQNLSDGQDTIVENIAQPGYNTYHEMPTGFVPPPGRPHPDVDRNITKALSFDPDVVIINLPSNDISSGYSKKECMDNLRTMFNTVTAVGKRCFITTTQPRHSWEFTDQMRQWQFELRDSVFNNFTVYAINFWDDLATTDNRIKPEVDAGDAIHINDLGHLYVFNRVKNANLFSSALPVQWGNVTAVQHDKRILLNWTTLNENNNDHFLVQRGSDINNFNSIGKIPGKGIATGSFAYSYTDSKPLPGNNYYRLVQVDRDGQQSFSKILRVSHTVSKPVISSIYAVSGGLMNVEIENHQEQLVTISLIDITGKQKLLLSTKMKEGVNHLRLPVIPLPRGIYYLKLHAGKETIYRSFFKE